MHFNFLTSMSFFHAMKIPPVKRWASTVLGLTFLVVTMIFQPSPVFAADASNPTIERIQSKGEIVVGIPPYKTPPFYSKGSDGELVGYDIDIAKKIAKSLEVQIRFDRNSTSFNNLVKRAGNSEVDFAIGKLGTTYNRLYNAFPHYYMSFRHAFLIDRKILALAGKENDCNQPLVMDIRPSPGFEGSFFAGELRLFPHTELAWHEEPPTFIGMFCINTGEENECQTISDSCKVIASLPEHIITWLRLKPIYFPSPKHIKTKGFTGNIIDGNTVRINSRDIRNNWAEEAEYFLQKLMDFEEKIYFKTGDFWVFDNRIYAHGRPKLSSKTKRHLLRVYGK